MPRPLPVLLLLSSHHCIFGPQETYTGDDHGTRKKKERDHTQGRHLGMFITCVPFGVHNGMDESFSSQQQEFCASFPLPQTIMLRLVFHTSAADFWQCCNAHAESHL
jgi:hypothetical protein